MSATEAQRRFNQIDEQPEAYRRYKRTQTLKRVAAENKQPQKYADRIMCNLSPEDY